jgi:hypothetical protein
MIYKKIGTLVALLSVESGASAMEKALHDAAVAALSNGSDELINEIDRGESLVSRFYRPLVRTEVFNRNLTGFWKTIPVATPLLRAVDNNHLQAFSFLGNSSYAIAATKKGRLFWWNTESMVYDEEQKGLPLFFRDTGQSKLSCMAVSSDGILVATSGDECIKIWSAKAEWLCIGTFAYDEEICTLSFNESATELIAGDAQGMLRIWSIEDTHKPSESIAVGIHFSSNDLFSTFNRVLAARLCRDGETILAAGYIMHAGSIKPIIRVINRARKESVLEAIIESRSPILGKIVFTDDTSALSTFSNGEIFKTDILNGTTNRITFKGFENQICESAVLTDDGRYLLTSGFGKVILWESNAQEFEMVREFTLTEPLMNRCAFRHDKGVFLMGSTLKGISFANLSLWSIKEPFQDMTLLKAREILRRQHVEGVSEKAQE